MKRVILAGVLALALGAMSAGKAAAQFGDSPFRCGIICLNMFPHMHQHGPLYNYGPYYGYAPFEPYGPWSSDLRYNGGNCANGHCGRSGLNLNWHLNLGHRNTGCDSCLGGSWGHYARSTFNNVFHRVNPLAHRHGHSCGLSCGSSTGGCTSCGGHTAAVIATPAQSVQPGTAHVAVR